MDVLGFVSTLVSLVILFVALYEGTTLSKLIGKIPRFWYFFLAAILYLVARRVVVLLAASLSVSLPGWWSAFDSDATPVIFSTLLLLFVYDMVLVFRRSVPKVEAGTVPPETGGLPVSEKV